MIFGNITYLNQILRERLDDFDPDNLGRIINDPNLQPGKHTVNDKLFYLVFNYDTKPEKEAAWEGHRIFSDIHIVVKGSEKVCFNDISRMSPINEYDPANDYRLFEGHPAGFVLLEKGYFVLFDPEDVHMTGLNTETGAEPVTKIVIKVKAL